MASRGISVSCPGLVHVVGTSPKRLRGVRGRRVDVSFVSAVTRVRGDDDDDDAVPALRELSDAADWRGRRPRAADLASLVCQA